MPLNPQATELNEVIRAVNPHVFDLLSEKGKAIYFPKRGILAQSADAKGKKINATIGVALEDNGAPMTLQSIDQQFNAGSKELFNYAPSPGRVDIRARWKEKMVLKNPLLKGQQISMPVVTSALTHGLSMAGYLFVNPGDTIISPDLYWENYELIFNLAYGGQFRTFPTFSGNGFNVDGLRDAIEQSPAGKKVVILNFPNNPTGYTATEQEGRQIRDILLASANAGNSIVLLVDDAYFGLVFEKGIMTESIFGLVANCHERILAVKFDGPTKEDYVWGFRVGFITLGTGKNSPELYSAMESKIGGAIRGNISNATNTGQMMLMKAYGNETYEQEKLEKYGILKRRYEKIRDILNTHQEYREFFEALPFNSGYFMCVQFKGIDTEAVRRVLLDKFSTGVIAQGSIIRIAFSSTPLSLIDTLMNNVYNACKELKKG